MKDSINANHMRAFDAGTTPDYTDDVAPTPLKSGLANNLALTSVHDDLFTDNNTIKESTTDDRALAPDMSRLYNRGRVPAERVNRIPRIVGREGHPNGSPNETLELKIRGDNICSRSSNSIRRESSAGVVDQSR